MIDAKAGGISWNKSSISHTIIALRLDIFPFWDEILSNVISYLLKALLVHRGHGRSLLKLKRFNLLILHVFLLWLILSEINIIL